MDDALDLLIRVILVSLIGFLSMGGFWLVSRRNRRIQAACLIETIKENQLAADMRTEKQRQNAALSRIGAALRRRGKA